MKEKILAWIGTLPYSKYIENKYLLALLIIIFSLLFAKLLLFIFSKYLEKLAKKTKTKIDDLIFAKTKKPIFYFIVIYGFRTAFQTIGWDGILSKIVNSFSAAIFLLILAKVVDVIIITWGESFSKKTKTKFDEVLLPLFDKSVKVIFFVIGFICILDIWGIDITPYLAGVGISGIVLGLALQDSLKNVFGGITLALDKTYLVGDKVQLEDKTVGTIYDVGLRSTKLITFDNEVVYLPNSYLANSKVQNYSRPDPRVRVKVDFAVEYGTSVDKVKKIILKEAEKAEYILKDPAPEVQFMEMGDFSLKFRLVFWVEKWTEAFDAKLKLNEMVYATLNKNKIGIPLPTRTVYIKKE